MGEMSRIVMIVEFAVFAARRHVRHYLERRSHAGRHWSAA